MHSSRAARAGRLPRVGLALVPALLLALGACGESKAQSVTGATAGPAGVSVTGPATPEPSSTSSASSAEPGQKPVSEDEGCPKGEERLPKEAVDGAQVSDLDGDGAPDEIWLADQGEKRLLGVRTAGGAVFSTTFQSASPQSARAVANRLGDGSAVILLSTGRSAALYAVVDCQIVPTENVNGEQYTFDLGFGGYGTGVACPLAQDELYLAGYQSKESKREGYAMITRTRIDLSENGARADNGTVKKLGEYGNDSATYRIAHEVSCGDSQAAEEPQN